jgi:hypothetical protein
MYNESGEVCNENSFEILVFTFIRQSAASSVRFLLAISSHQTGVPRRPSPIDRNDVFWFQVGTIRNFEIRGFLRDLCVDLRIILSPVCGDYIRRVLDWQLDLLDHTQLHTITVYTLYDSTTTELLLSLWRPRLPLCNQLLWRPLPSLTKWSRSAVEY